MRPELCPFGTALKQMGARSQGCWANHTACTDLKHRAQLFTCSKAAVATAFFYQPLLHQHQHSSQDSRWTFQTLGRKNWSSYRLIIIPCITVKASDTLPQGESARLLAPHPCQNTWVWRGNKLQAWQLRPFGTNTFQIIVKYLWKKPNPSFLHTWNALLKKPPQSNKVLIAFIIWHHKCLPSLWSSSRQLYSRFYFGSPKARINYLSLCAFLKTKDEINSVAAGWQTGCSWRCFVKWDLWKYHTWITTVVDQAGWLLYTG